MINNSKEEDSQTKKDRTINDGKTNTKASSSISAPWLRLKDPRIVRVSRAFGGKDRHSKVCTIRGLRDRRVRLSVPTAIQLYDLQDRLGLNQPSKVIDWLLNAAKHEIDELPPLPISPMSFGLNHQPILPHEVGTSQFNKEGFKMNNWEDQSGLTRPSSWSGDAQLRTKSKQVAEESAKRDELDEQESNEEDNSSTPQVQFSSARLFRAAQSSSSATGLMNNPMPYGSFFQLEHTNYPFSQMGSFGFQNQADNLQDLNTVPLPSPLSLSSSSQVFLCPQGTPQLYLPSRVSADSADPIDPRQLNHFQMLPSSTQNLFPSSIDNDKAFPFPQQWKSA